MSNKEHVLRATKSLIVEPRLSYWGSILLAFKKTTSIDPVLSSLADRQTRLDVLIKIAQADKEPDRVEPAYTAQGDRFSESPIADTFSKRRYKLAVTDLAVENALDLLDKKSRSFRRWGFVVYLFSMMSILSGLLFSGWQVTIDVADKKAEAPQQFSIPLIAIAAPPASAASLPATSEASSVREWTVPLGRFVRGFTFYGFIVLLAVALWRVGRALLDQAERLNDRRHALRQGRLFVHLKEGELTIEEMERAFAWNISQTNAFANMLTEAKAPWGAVLSELFKSVPELVKAGADAARRDKEGPSRRI